MWHWRWVQRLQPEQAANFEDIGPGEHFDNFISAQLTNSYSDNITEHKQTGRPSPLGSKKAGIFAYLPWAEGCNIHQSE